MTEALFTVTVGPSGAHGPIRLALDGRMMQLEGRDWEPDLTLLAQALANRLDQAEAARDRRGFVTLSQEYRACRIDLFGADDGGADDGLSAAIAAFAEAENGHAQDARGPD